MNDAPVFIVGNRRSGTTMLRLMLTSHPRIGIPPEGGFVVSLGWIWQHTHLSSNDYQALVDAFLAEDNAQDWGIPPQVLRAAIEARRPTTFAQFADETYRQYLRSRFPGKARWGDKTTWYLDFVPMIAEMIPEALFVNIVRDGRDVACSYRGTKHLTHDVRRIALEWATSIETAERARERLGASRFLQIKYERLTADPRRELNKVCSFLGEEFSEDMLAFHQKNKDLQLEPARHMGWKQKTTKAADTASVGRWQAELDSSLLIDFESVAGHALSHLGYERATRPASATVRLFADARARAFGEYWRTRQVLRGLKARLKWRLDANR